MNAITHVDNPLFCEQQKFGLGEGLLHYYLFYTVLLVFLVVLTKELDRSLNHTLCQSRLTLIAIPCPIREVVSKEEARQTASVQGYSSFVPADGFNLSCINHSTTKAST